MSKDKSAFAQKADLCKRSQLLSEKFEYSHFLFGGCPDIMGRSYMLITSRS